MPRNPSIKSPWAARDRVAEREAKREAVLQTAARAFAENGYHRTSLEEIAARLGVSKPTIYYYAQNKDDLVAAIAARALDEIDRKSTRLNSSHSCAPRMPSSA